MFELHPQLQADTVILGDLALCRVLLMNDANYPWVILVPRVAGAREIFELDDADQMRLLRESSLIAHTLNELFTPDKLNVAALGNVVPQLHIHVIARYRTDPAWPAPVWGKVATIPYTPETLRDAAKKIIAALGDALAPAQAFPENVSRP